LSCLFLESLSAFGAGDVHLSLALGHTQGVAAAGAFKELVGPALFAFADEKLKLSADGPPIGEETVILLAALVDLAGKHTEYGQHHKHIVKDVQPAQTGYDAQKPSGEGGDKQPVIQMILTVATYHEISQPVSDHNNPPETEPLLPLS